MKVLLVDDESPARERLRHLLGAFEDVEIVGEAEDGEQAMERIAELTPDLVFLDIQMPGPSGMEVAASLRAPRPRIVFCTAYDEYAVDAFELHAIDYLLKPVNRTRLARAVERARATPGAGADASLDAASRAASGGPIRFLARRGSRYHVVATDSVVCFTSEHGQTRLETAEQHFWMQPSLNELEQRLDPSAFFRVSRGAMVRLDAVREVVPTAGGYGELVLSHGGRVEVSRRRFKELIARLEGG